MGKDLKNEGKAKKLKDKLIFKKKMKKMLSRGSYNAMTFEAEMTDLNCITDEECGTSSFEPLYFEDSKKRNDRTGHKKIEKEIKCEDLLKSHPKLSIKKNVEAKNTPKDETAMLSIISDIICADKTKSKKKIRESSKNLNESSVKSSTKDEMFDPNKSLAQKIIENIKEKNSNDKDSHTILPVVRKKVPEFLQKNNLLKSMSSYSIPKRKLSPKLDFKQSVLEVFDNYKPLKKAKIFSVKDPCQLTKQTFKQNIVIKKPEAFIQENFSENANSSLESLEEHIDALTVDKPVRFQTDDNEHFKTAPLSKLKSYTLFVLPDCCVVILKSKTKLFFCGMLKASLINGSVEILGYTLTKVSQEIYSLPNYSLLCFESFDATNMPLKMSQLVDARIPSSKTQEILEATHTGDSVILLQPHRNVMSDFVSQYFTSQSYNSDLFSRPKLDENHHNSEAFKLLKCHFSTESRKGLFVQHFLSKNISELILKTKKENSMRNVTILCGGKNAGKSTMLRYLVNKTVKEGPVLVVDLDPGQCELTVCGLVSSTLVTEPLLGPNFTHLKQPDRSICLGFINVSENKLRYTRCVQDLYMFCSNNTKYKDAPWIINTMGFTGTLGLKLLTIIINIFKPTTLVELKSIASRDNFEIQLSNDNVNYYQSTCNIEREVRIQKHSYHYYCLDPFQDKWNSSKSSIHRKLEPKIERVFNALAYFSQIATGRSLSILEMVPYVISLDDIGLVFNDICVEYSQALSVLNGQMVALCKDKRFDSQRHPKNTLFGIELAYCYGYGIIRGIDLEQRKLYIITPVDSRDISYVNSLVYGECYPRCTNMLMGGLSEGTVVPYTNNLHSAEHDYLTKSPKRNFNPFRLLKMQNN